MTAPSPKAQPPRPRPGPLRRVVAHFQRTFAAGILVILPIGITILILKFFFDLLDPLLGKTALKLAPGPEIPGLGVAALAVLVYLAGLIATYVLGRRLIAFGHRVMELIPVVKSIYGTIRTAVDLVSNTNQRRYSGVVLLEFPRAGMHSVGLVTSRMVDPNGEETLAVYIPGTPIPSSGFLVFVPAREVTPTEMTVDEAMRIVISGGLLAEQVFQRIAGAVAATGAAEDRSRSNQ